MDPWMEESGPFNTGQGENIKKITQDHGSMDPWIQESGPFNIGQG